MGQAQSIQFLALGDWGCDTDHQKWVAEQMAMITKEHEPVDQFFVVALGDNFYESGVDSITDKKWKSVFSEPYEKVTCPWYPILGNHDWEGNPQAQIDFKTDKRWQMESIYYTKTIGNVQLVFIDTTTLCPNISEMYTGSEFSNVMRDKQLLWLKRTLKSANDNNKWVIVFGHYPVHSGGSSGTMKEMLIVNELLHKYHVNVYFSGHDHSLQHLFDAHKKMHYFVSGSGCESIPVRSRTDLTKFCAECEGFMSVRIPRDGTSMHVRFISHNGSELYNVTVNKIER